MIFTLSFCLLKKAWSLVLLITKIFKWKFEKICSCSSLSVLDVSTFGKICSCSSLSVLDVSILGKICSYSSSQVFLILWKFLTLNALKFLFLILDAWDLDVLDGVGVESCLSSYDDAYDWKSCHLIIFSWFDTFLMHEISKKFVTCNLKIGASFGAFLKFHFCLVLKTRIYVKV